MAEIKTYWYCETHDDAYYMRHCLINEPNFNVTVDPFEYNANIHCCSNREQCELLFIGYRKYNIDRKVIADTTPNRQWFDRRAGGFERKYLNSVSKISLTK